LLAGSRPRVRSDREGYGKNKRFKECASLHVTYLLRPLTLLRGAIRSASFSYGRFLTNRPRCYLLRQAVKPDAPWAKRPKLAT
jgi:hypothetical protein